MAQHAPDPAYRRVEVDEFLQMDFPATKAELDHCVVRMMTGGNEAHVRIATNLIAFLLPRLRGNAGKQLLGDPRVVF